MLIKFLACMGLVWILKDSYILSRPRNYLKSKSKHLKEFLSCSLCLGFWAGLLLACCENSSNFSIKFTLKTILPSKVAVACVLYPSVSGIFPWVSSFFISKMRCAGAKTNVPKGGNLQRKW